MDTAPVDEKVGAGPAEADDELAAVGPNQRAPTGPIVPE